MGARSTAAADGSAARRRAGRFIPIGRILLYYGALVVLGALLMWLVPGARGAMVAPLALPPGPGGELFGSGGVPPVPWQGEGGRGALALSAVLGALALALPVAWAHMWTRRFRYDPSLVQAIIVLPIVVAGVVLVVRNSLALAFALAGIVAGVRFRQKLNEPQDAVYVLLALGIGLAAGVQALDVALVISLVFNLVVLALWRWDVGGLEPGAAGTLLYAGDAGVLAPAGSVDRQEVEERALAGADGMRTDGILVVHAADPEAARRTLEVAVARVARDWKVTKPTAAGNGRSRFEVLVRLRRDADPADLMAEVRDRWTDRITAAEYIPFRLPGGGE